MYTHGYNCIYVGIIYICESRLPKAHLSEIDFSLSAYTYTPSAIFYKVWIEANSTAVGGTHNTSFYFLHCPGKQRFLFVLVALSMK